MFTTLIAWAISFFTTGVFAIFLGLRVCVAKTPLGILIDSRGRYSLTHLQLVLWTVTLVSLIAGVFIGRLTSNIRDALDFSIPAQVLGLLGISVGSAVSATAIKATKDTTSPERVAASRPGDGSSDATRPRLAQVFLSEEGTFANNVIDITKFQNFCFTIVLLAAYIAQAVSAITDSTLVNTLPTLNPTFLTLLGISHAAYVAGKIPTQQGSPEGLSVADIRQRR